MYLLSIKHSGKRGLSTLANKLMEESSYTCFAPYSQRRKGRDAITTVVCVAILESLIEAR